MLATRTGEQPNMIDYPGPTQHWANALRRAHAANIRTWERRSDHSDFFIFETTSHEENAPPVYTVAVRADADGIHVSCDCLAGMNNRPCQHAAQVLNKMGHLPDLPESYTGGSLRSTWGKPAGAPIDGKAALRLLNGID